MKYIDEILTFHKMPCHSIKYYTKNDAYGMFVRRFVEQRDLTEDALI